LHAESRAHAYETATAIFFHGKVDRRRCKKLVVPSSPPVRVGPAMEP